MKKLITYTEDQVSQLTGLLNGISTTGIQNAKQISVIAQILDSGVAAELKEKEGETKHETG